MKKLLIASFLFFNTLTHADEYISLHNSVFLDHLLSSTLLSGGNFTENYQLPVNKHSSKSAASGLPYHPQGWDKFKLYVPAGTRADVVISTTPNTTLRAHIKFNGINNSTITHYIPLGTVSDAITQHTAERVILNSTSHSFLNSGQLGAWLYWDVVEDSANSYAEHGYISQTTLSIQHKLRMLDRQNFDAWLYSTTFLSQGGDPSASMAAMNIIDLTTPDTPSNRAILLDQGSFTYNGTVGTREIPVNIYPNVKLESILNLIDVY